MKKENLTKEENNQRKQNLKKLVIAMIILDFVGIFNLVLQIYLKDISYFPLIILIVCNIIVFGTYKITKDR